MSRSPCLVPKDHYQLVMANCEQHGLCLLSLGMAPFRISRITRRDSLIEDAVDGGGIRGVSELIILKEIMDRVHK